MKTKHILTTSLLCLAINTPVFANRVELCDTVARTAEQLQISNQNGKSLSFVFGLIVKSEMNTEAKNFIQNLAVEAYSIPRFSSSKYQAKAIADFKDAKHVECMKHGYGLD